MTNLAGHQKDPANVLGDAGREATVSEKQHLADRTAHCDDLLHMCRDSDSRCGRVGLHDTLRYLLPRGFVASMPASNRPPRRDEVRIALYARGRYSGISSWRPSAWSALLAPGVATTMVQAMDRGSLLNLSFLWPAPHNSPILASTDAKQVEVRDAFAAQAIDALTLLPFDDVPGSGGLARTICSTEISFTVRLPRGCASLLPYHRKASNRRSISARLFARRCRTKGAKLCNITDSLKPLVDDTRPWPTWVTGARREKGREVVMMTLLYRSMSQTLLGAIACL